MSTPTPRPQPDVVIPAPTKDWESIAGAWEKRARASRALLTKADRMLETTGHRLDNLTTSVGKLRAQIKHTKDN